MQFLVQHTDSYYDVLLHNILPPTLIIQSL